MNKLLSHLPQVGRLLNDTRLHSWHKLPRTIRAQVIRQVIQEAREGSIKNNVFYNEQQILERIQQNFFELENVSLQKVVNGTGILLHTNLGRAPLGKALLEQMAYELDGYSNLELDLSHGLRDQRTRRITQLLKLGLGVESATVVNNNASALLLIFHTLGAGKQVILSRGEMVQIGGGFRIHEMIAAAGASVHEIGTTNISTIEDYKKACVNPDAIVLKVHRSNFTVSGHVHEPSFKELADLSQQYGVPFVIDMGSSDFTKQSELWDYLKVKNSILCFSADKMLGGPQAGIILAKLAVIEALQQNPIYRALRMGKFELFLLEKTLLSAMRGESSALRELTETPVAALEKRAKKLLRALKPTWKGALRADPSSATMGGGSLTNSIPSLALYLEAKDTQILHRHLLAFKPSIVARKEKGHIVIDLRTVFPNEDVYLIEALRQSPSVTLH